MADLAPDVDAWEKNHDEDLGEITLIGSLSSGTLREARRQSRLFVLFRGGRRQRLSWLSGSVMG